MLTRRKAMGSLAAATAALYLPACARSDRPIAGRILGAPASLGHRLRSPDFPAPTSTRKTEVVIVGGGIAGLTAARELQQRGVRDVLILEASSALGGNSSFGENSVSAFPWGAHYVPLVRNDDSELLKLFRSMDIVTDFDGDVPIYNEYFLSADPQERLYIHGRWQEGLLPAVGISGADRSQYARFFDLIGKLKTAKGRDGKPLFAIPIDRSSTDEEWRALDRLSMADYLRTQGFDSPSLLWYIEYGCRDDYGATLAKTSAWAGLHYFASRTGCAANAGSSAVVTWPEGNGFFVRSWASHLKDKVEMNALAYSVTDGAQGASVEYFDAVDQRSVRIESRAVVLALPNFVIQRIWKGLAPASMHEYSPWVVANLTLDRLPQGRGMDLAWDNVVMNSPMLGYVVADHQSLKSHKTGTVITYYWPLSHTDPAAARAEALNRSHYDWQTLITKDLYKVHPDLRGHVAQLDVMIWGHGMRRPTPGGTWGKNSGSADTARRGPVFVAHSDQSGISIFEEAFHHGLNAAKSCDQYLKQRSA